MSWNDILTLLIQLISESLPDVFDALLTWLKDRLGVEAEGAAETGTLAEFKSAVKRKLKELSVGAGFLRRFLLNMLANRASDLILDRLYEIVTGKATAAPPTFGVLDADTAAALDELDQASNLL